MTLTVHVWMLVEFFIINPAKEWTSSSLLQISKEKKTKEKHTFCQPFLWQKQNNKQIN